MNTTQLIKPSRPSGGHEPTATLNIRPPASEFPPPGERLIEILPLIFAVPVAGPPVILLLGPLLLIVLLLIPPAALLITLVVVSVVATGLLVALVALVASPYLLIRHVLKHRTRGPERHTAAHRLREGHPTGVSLRTQCTDARRFGGPVAPTGVHLRHDAQINVTSRGT